MRVPLQRLALCSPSLLRMATATASPATPAAPAAASSWLSWRWSTATAERQLYYQQRLLANVPDLKAYNVPLPDRNHIHTLELGSKASPPLVLVHGLGAGAAAYAKNLLPLSQRYHVYAIDLLGFAASSRPDFASDDPDVLEGQFLTSIDQWRQAVGLSRFVLLGHSFGGYLVTAYAMRHPEQIRHLVLADPWGFPAKPTAEEQEVIWQRAKWRPSFALRTFIGIMSRYPPYASMRIAGPWGQSLVARARPDLANMFDPTGAQHEDFFGWVYHSNAQPPSGENAFHKLSIPIGWAKRPMQARIGTLDARVPITFIFGAQSFISSEAGYKTQKMREGLAPVHVFELPNIGHHVMWETSGDFNRYVLNLELDDEGESAAATPLHTPPVANHHQGDNTPVTVAHRHLDGHVVLETLA